MLLRGKGLRVWIRLLITWESLVLRAAAGLCGKPLSTAERHAQALPLDGSSVASLAPRGGAGYCAVHLSFPADHYAEKGGSRMKVTRMTNGTGVLV